MKPGKARDRITFQRYERAENEFGEPVDTEELVVIGRAWAQINYGKGSERREAAQESATVAATFRVRDMASTRAAGTTAQIEFGGLWDIESNVPVPNELGWRDITATKAVQS